MNGDVNITSDNLFLSQISYRVILNDFDVGSNDFEMFKCNCYYFAKKT